MTQLEREEILRLRLEGKSYTQIADKLQTSRNTVKSTCQRFGCQPNEITKEIHDSDHCRLCGTVLAQQATGKRKSFCSELCRRAWWKQHQDKRSFKSGVKAKCANCGRVFLDYEKNRRKYCCHACYIHARFGGKKTYDKRAV
jgi:IS30 family transposase